MQPNTTQPQPENGAENAPPTTGDPFLDRWVASAALEAPHLAEIPVLIADEARRRVQINEAKLLLKDLQAANGLIRDKRRALERELFREFRDHEPSSVAGKTISGLKSEREASTLARYYDALHKHLSGATYASIAVDYGISAGRAGQIVKSGKWRAENLSRAFDRAPDAQDVAAFVKSQFEPQSQATAQKAAECVLLFRTQKAPDRAA